MDTRARHLLVELHGCDRALLNDAERLRLVLREAAAAAGATIVAEVLHPYTPHGVTGVFVIEESHFSLHTWPEVGYAAVDFYTCGGVSPERAAAVLRQALAAESMRLLMIERGRPLGEDPFRVVTLPER